MKNIQEYTGKLSIIERLKNSHNGNPRYLISVGDVVCKTGVDYMHAYSITNYKNQMVKCTIGVHYRHTTLCTIEKI